MRSVRETESRPNHTVDPVGGETVWVVSRCAWTLFNFRLGIMNAIQSTGIKLVALGAGGDGFEDALRGAGINYQNIPVDRKGINPLADLRLFFHLLKRMRRERPALVHLFTIKPVVYGGAATRLANVPAVATITGLGYVFTSGGSTLRTITEALYRVALRRMHTVFFQNAEDRDYFLSRHMVRASQAQLVPGSGVDTDQFSPPPGRDIVNPTFLMVARLIGEKGVLEYIEAAKRVRTQFPKVRCVLVGAPDERNPTAISVDVIRDAEQQGYIEWKGWATHVDQWLAQSDVVVLPSYREGLPRSLLEAAAMGRAIITTDTTGCRDVVSNGVNGILVPVRDAAALANAMTALVEDPQQITKFGHAGRARILRQFDERLVIERTLAAYKSAGIGV